MMLPYFSIDLETTGLNPETCQILEIGCVYDDCVSPINQLKTFHCYVRHDVVQGQYYALQMNVDIIREILNEDNASEVMAPHQVTHYFREWLCGLGYNNEKGIYVAGKNFATFDALFLKKLPDWHKIRIKHRTIDPGMLYWYDDDTDIPDLATCLERAGISKSVTHRAIDDALDVVKLIRRYHNVLS